MPAPQTPARPNIASFQDFIARLYLRSTSSVCSYQKALIISNSLKSCGKRRAADGLSSSPRAAPAPPRRLIVELLFGRASVDDAVVDLERHAVEKFAAGAGGSGDTLATHRLIVGVVRLAH